MGRHSLAGFGLSVALLLGAVLSGRPLRLAAAERHQQTQRYEDIYYVPPPSWLRVFSLGHDEALADLLWMRALVNFGDEVKHMGEVAHALDYAEAIVTLDPYFQKAYSWAGTAGMYKPIERGQQSGLTEGEAARAVSFLRRGARQFPDDGEMAWDLGASVLFELVPMVKDAARQEQLRQEGVAQLQTAARLGGGPAWLALTNATQLQRLGQQEQAIRHLEEMYSVVQDEQVRSQIQRELELLRNRSFAEALERTWHAFEERRRREFAYLPQGLFLFLDPEKDGTDASSGAWH